MDFKSTYKSKCELITLNISFKNKIKIIIKIKIFKLFSLVGSSINPKLIFKLTCGLILLTILLKLKLK